MSCVCRPSFSILLLIGCVVVVVFRGRAAVHRGVDERQVGARRHGDGRWVLHSAGYVIPVIFFDSFCSLSVRVYRYHPTAG